MNIDRLARVVRVRYLHAPLATPAIPIQPEPWMDLALCAQVDPEMFYPEKGGNPSLAKKICRVCEVRTVCLEYALRHDERSGIWGGTTPNQRKAMRRAAAS